MSASSRSDVEKVSDVAALSQDFISPVSQGSRQFLSHARIFVKSLC